jgi:hypothetical protein
VLFSLISSGPSELRKGGNRAKQWVVDWHVSLCVLCVCLSCWGMHVRLAGLAIFEKGKGLKFLLSFMLV